MSFKFLVEQEVLDLGLKAKGVVIEGIDNKNMSEAYQNYRKEEISRLFEKYVNVKAKEDPIVEGFYALHSKVHVRRRNNAPSVETLIRLLQKREDLPHINKVVDIYNIISTDLKISLGAHDIDKIDGNVTLKIQDGTERFVPLGSDEAQEVKAGEYSYIDEANDIICHLEIRQVNKTLVDENTKNIFIIVQGNEVTSDELLEKTCQQLIEIITKYCGGNGKIIR